MSTAKKDSEKLTPRQRLFCEQYVKLNSNGTQAAIAAGYCVKGGEGAAAAHASRLLKSVKIQEYIQSIWRRHHMTADEVVARLAAMAKGDATQLVNARGHVDMAKVKANGVIVKSIKHDARGRLQVELHDQQAALVHVGKALGVFKESVSLEAAGGGPLVVQLAMDPAAITGQPKGKA